MSEKSVFKSVEVAVYGKFDTKSVDLDGRAVIGHGYVLLLMCIFLAIHTMYWYNPLRDRASVQYSLHIQLGLKFGSAPTFIGVNVDEASYQFSPSSEVLCRETEIHKQDPACFALSM